MIDCLKLSFLRNKLLNVISIVLTIVAMVNIFYVVLINCTFYKVVINVKNSVSTVENDLYKIEMDFQPMGNVMRDDEWQDYLSMYRNLNQNDIIRNCGYYYVDDYASLVSEGKSYECHVLYVSSSLWEAFEIETEENQPALFEENDCVFVGDKYRTLVEDKDVEIKSDNVSIGCNNRLFLEKNQKFLGDKLFNGLGIIDLDNYIVVETDENVIRENQYIKMEDASLNGYMIVDSQNVGKAKKLVESSGVGVSVTSVSDKIKSQINLIYEDNKTANVLMLYLILLMIFMILVADYICFLNLKREMAILLLNGVNVWAYILSQIVNSILKFVVSYVASFAVWFALFRENEMVRHAFVYTSAFIAIIVVMIMWIVFIQSIWLVRHNTLSQLIGGVFYD